MKVQPTDLFGSYTKLKGIDATPWTASDADFDLREDGSPEYRYTLLREWDRSLPTLLWIMLNPSIANVVTLDPTLKRCFTFSRDLGYGAMVIANLYALIDPKPIGLKKHRDPVGPRNDETIRSLAGDYRVVLGWGNSYPKKTGPARAKAVVDLIRAAGREPMALAVNEDGTPVHPLYQPKNLIPRPLSELLAGR